MLPDDRKHYSGIVAAHILLSKFRKGNKMKNGMKINLGVHVVLTGLIVLIRMSLVTDVELHRWVGMLFGAGLLIHIMFHCKWTMATIKSFASLPARVRVNFLLNMLLMFLFTVTIISGLFNSPLPVDRATAHGVFMWHAIHAISSRLALLTVVVHLILHRKWIANALKRKSTAPIFSN